MKMHDGRIELAGQECQITFPAGCTGVLLCFDSKKAARQYFGKNIELLKYEVKE